MDFETVKLIHLTTIVFSLSLFLLRFYAVMFVVQRILALRILKIIPHVNDTVLLASGVTLAVKLGLTPGDNPWLLAKIIALVGYIVAGSFALKRGKTQKIKLLSGVIALSIFAFIISVAVSKNSGGFIF